MAKFVGNKENEVFVGNIGVCVTGHPVRIPEFLSSLKTLRMGEQALDINGNELDPAQYRPLFIASHEEKQYGLILQERARRG